MSDRPSPKAYHIGQNRWDASTAHTSRVRNDRRSKPQRTIQENLYRKGDKMDQVRDVGVETGMRLRPRSRRSHSRTLHSLVGRSRHTFGEFCVFAWQIQDLQTMVLTNAVDRKMQLMQTKFKLMVLTCEQEVKAREGVWGVSSTCSPLTLISLIPTLFCRKTSARQSR